MIIKVNNRLIRCSINALLRVIFPLLMVFLNPFLLSAYAQGDSAVNQLVAILSQSSSMQADVEQLTLDQGGVELQEVKARLVMQKPDHFYWELSEPYEELMVTNGDKVWIYEPDLDQVTIRDFETDLSRTPLLFLNADAELLARTYSVSRNVLPDSQYARFVLLPLEPGSQLERLSLTFLEDKLEEMQYETTLGQSISLYFSNLEVNFAVDMDLFEFMPPTGIEIIDTTEN
jgi:outer membrane lipoprotein carrier protein